MAWHTAVNAGQQGRVSPWPTLASRAIHTTLRPRRVHINAFSMRNLVAHSLSPTHSCSAHGMHSKDDGTVALATRRRAAPPAAPQVLPRAPARPRHRTTNAKRHQGGRAPERKLGRQIKPLWAMSTQTRSSELRGPCPLPLHVRWAAAPPPLPEKTKN